MAMIKVKPSSAGLKVRNPKTMQFIPEGGAMVSAEDTYWDRRLKSGDVILVVEKEEKAAVKPESKISKTKQGGA